MKPSALDARTKELIYLAVSIKNRYDFCIEAHSNICRNLGMTAEMYGELMAVVSMANGLNSFGVGYQIRLSDLREPALRANEISD